MKSRAFTYFKRIASASVEDVRYAKRSRLRRDRRSFRQMLKTVQFDEDCVFANTLVNDHWSVS